MKRRSITEKNKPRLAEAFGAKIDGAILFGADKPASWRDDIVKTASNAMLYQFVNGNVSGPVKYQIQLAVQYSVEV